MPTLKPGHISPTDEDEATIQAQIADDPDDCEKDAAWFRDARPATEAVPHIVERHRPGRGRQKSPTKVFVGIRLDADIVAHFRRGW